jgi:hypothetical protein
MKQVAGGRTSVVNTILQGQQYRHRPNCTSSALYTLAQESPTPPQ